MESNLTALMGWIGIYGPVALASIGSAIGCTIAGKAACGAVLEVDGGYGRYIGLSVLPSSIVIYGIVIMFSLNRPVGPATSPGLFGVGLLVGVALLYIAILQGQCCAAAINASKGKPAIFGISVTPAAIVEGFAVFAFVSLHSSSAARSRKVETVMAQAPVIDLSKAGTAMPAVESTGVDTPHQPAARRRHRARSQPGPGACHDGAETGLGYRRGAQREADSIPGHGQGRGRQTESRRRTCDWPCDARHGSVARR